MKTPRHFQISISNGLLKVSSPTFYEYEATLTSLESPLLVQKINFLLPSFSEYKFPFPYKSSIDVNFIHPAATAQILRALNNFIKKIPLKECPNTLIKVDEFLGLICRIFDLQRLRNEAIQAFNSYKISLNPLAPFCQQKMLQISFWYTSFTISINNLHMPVTFEGQVICDAFKKPFSDILGECMRKKALKILHYISKTIPGEIISENIPKLKFKTITIYLTRYGYPIVEGRPDLTPLIKNNPQKLIKIVSYENEIYERSRFN